MKFVKTFCGPGWRRYIDKSGGLMAGVCLFFFALFLAAYLYFAKNPTLNRPPIPIGGLILFGTLTLPWAVLGLFTKREIRVDANTGDVIRTTGPVFSPKVAAMPFSEFASVTCWSALQGGRTSVYRLGLKYKVPQGIHAALHLNDYSNLEAATTEAAILQALTHLPLHLDDRLRDRTGLEATGLDA